ncbi:MAG TPA: hypothetical protein VIX89_08630 [Bryobacteraceae bacterium]
MKCRYCNVALAPLRSLTDGEFCCDDHREAFHELDREIARLSSLPLSDSLVRLHVALTGAAADIPSLAAGLSEAQDFRTEMTRAVEFSAQTKPSDQHAGLPAADQLFPLNVTQTAAEWPAVAPIADLTESGFLGRTIYPRNTAPPVSIPVLDSSVMDERQAAPDWAANAVPEMRSDAALGAAGEDGKEDSLHPSAEAPKSWRWLADVWRKAPSDLKFITVLLPILLAVAIGPSVPKISIAQVNPGGVQQIVKGQWKDLHQTILNRAAVAYADDFRSGLDAWESRSNLTTSWSYDATGFVQPGPLAVFKPSIDMADYRFEFLGEIDQKGMGCAFRAKDLNNYYALKFTVVKPGPLPMVRMVRYAVINGKEGPHVEKPLPLTVRKDMLYRVMLNVQGSDFTIMAQGQVVDFWSDDRLKRGGVGFFCGRGEKARLRWVEVSHQYDTLGRLCAYLAPYGIEGRNGNWN